MFNIAIPSYNRVETLRKKTLNYLKECGIDKSKITIFVANEEQKEIYSIIEGYNIIIAEPGITAARNFIRNYYKENDLVVSMDDDIECLLSLNKEGKLEKFNNLEGFIKLSFNDCIKNNTKLWGISAVQNPFFMKRQISTGLKFIVGCFYGMIIDKRKDFFIPKELLVKEDYYLTIIHYKTFGSVLRYDFICPKTKYYTEDGGLSGVRETEHSKHASIWLKTNFPEYVTIKSKSSSGHMEILLKNKKK